MGKSYREPKKYDRERRLHSVQQGKGPKKVPGRDIINLLNPHDGLTESQLREEAIIYMELNDPH